MIMLVAILLLINWCSFVRIHLLKHTPFPTCFDNDFLLISTSTRTNIELLLTNFNLPHHGAINGPVCVPIDFILTYFNLPQSSVM